MIDKIKFYCTNVKEQKRILCIVVSLCILLAVLYMTELSTNVVDNFQRKERNMNSSLLVKLMISGRKRIAIIGSSGYIGSRLLEYLESKQNLEVNGFDRKFKGQASYEISTRLLKKYDIVIYLGGLTGRVMCQQRPNDIEQENIGDIYQLARRMLPSQLLIFASTSAIAEGSGSKSFQENSSVKYNLFDLYTDSMFRRENTLRNLSKTRKDAPQMIGLRFGTVIGLSKSQRIDLVHMALVCQAFLNHRIRITYPDSYRAFLDMNDLVRAISTIIEHSKKAQRFDLFHLQTFSGSISNVANTVGMRTRAFIDAIDQLGQNNSVGFSLDTTKFSTTFNFTFRGIQDEIIRKMMQDVPRMCLGRQSRIDNHSIPCVVCGSTEMHTVLDLHEQPLANEFRNRTEDSLKCQRFPLRLVRCPKCYHTQLSYIVDRSYLFSHYLYQSGTSQSLQNYFEWLAKKIIEETSIINGTVLEIACNDGSQLNQFLKQGWKTIGVEPAQNLAEIARKSGHTVYTGFWGVDQFPLLELSKTLDAIVAQNVFAHVTNPVDFLRACLNVMNDKTKLYIQTSQCEMYETGQFDTVYHEHISFFTAHSFKKIADLVGLTIINFEITPIHGRSCLVTFQRIAMESSVSFETVYDKEDLSPIGLVIQKERQLGLTKDWFYLKFQAQTETVRQWMMHQLTNLHEQSHTIVAYGAAAKGMVLLHFLLESPNRIWNISYVIDDAPLKQNTFCPGTNIPVRPSSILQQHNLSKPLTIIIFAWNFGEEIIGKIRRLTVDKGIENVFIMLPFPQQKLFKLETNTSHTLLSDNIYKPLPWPSEFQFVRRPVLLVSHLFNEEFLLPYWIRHHASMFDMAILIDYNSTDRSLEIIRQEAPHTWKVVTTRNKEFDAELVDSEVKNYEATYPFAWKITLNTPEFLIHPDLRQELANLDQGNVTTQAFRFPSIIMSGNDSKPLERFSSLIKQRSQYLCDKSDHGEGSYSRFIHRYPYGPYSLGRHDLPNTKWEWIFNGYIAKFMHTPWPEIMSRKLQIRARIPLHHFRKGWGNQHDVDDKRLTKVRNDIQQQKQCDLRNFATNDDRFKIMHRIWHQVINH